MNLCDKNKLKCVYIIIDILLLNIIILNKGIYYCKNLYIEYLLKIRLSF